MDIEELIEIRNMLNTHNGEVLLDYLHNCLTDYCTKNLNPEIIKGFGMCIQTIKDVPKKVESTKNRRN